MPNATTTLPFMFSLNWYSYPSLFEGLRSEPLNSSELLADFEAIQLPPDVSIIESARQADVFFEKYGVGNNMAQIDRPFERFHAYELLLATLAGHNLAKYKQIHKGTPYYFLGWTAFQTENYEKGIYYFDQGIVEDIRKSDTTNIEIIKQNPAVKSLLLDPQATAGVVTALELRAEMDAAFTAFSRDSGLTLNASLFTENFVIGFGNFLDSNFRTLVTSIYSFVLEYHTLVNALNLRSVSGGSLEPFFLHLFKGGLLLESVLKLKCPSTIITLKPAIRHLNGDLAINMNILRGGTLQDVVQHVNALAANGENFQNLAFATAYGIRNTTGHNLVWSDVFGNDAVVYQRLYTQTLDAIFWSICKLLISNS